MASPILQGLLSTSLLSSGYVGAPLAPGVPATGNVVVQGFGSGGLLLLQGFGSGAPVSLSLSFLQAVIAAVLADPTLSGLLGTQVYPDNLPASSTYPAVSVAVVDRTRGHNLKGSDGTADARVEFGIMTRAADDTQAIADGLFNLFDGLINASLSGVSVLFAIADDEACHYDDPADDSDAGTHSDAFTFLFRYRIARPSR